MNTRIMKGGIALAALVVLGMVGQPSTSFAEFITTEPMGDVRCDYSCRTCSGGHDLVVAVQNEDDGVHLETCNAGGCDLHACPSASTRVRNTWTVVRTLNGEDLTAALANLGDHVTYNPDRDAVQVTCDAGNLIANFPVSHEQVAVLE